LHGVAAARAGAPAITSMIAARKAAKADNLGSEHPPGPKMSADPPGCKVARRTDAATRPQRWIVLRRTMSAKCSSTVRERFPCWLSAITWVSRQMVCEGAGGRQTHSSGGDRGRLRRDGGGLGAHAA
jgi:hypothetical protein